jgi:DNA invertase Pin-like site-specific DNA recombinase
MKASRSPADGSKKRPFVTYLRVSTEKQGRSGLGMEAQQKMISDYLAAVAGVSIGTFTETESGKIKDRPQLRKAMALARRQRATLIVAKLDRLARNAAFITALQEEKDVEFIAVDCPNANQMMIQILAVFGQYEREQISKRTKDALAARKARGLKLGNLKTLRPGASPAARLNKARAQREAEEMFPVIAQLRREGITSIRKIAAALNEQGYTTNRGRMWHARQVGRLLDRLPAGEGGRAGRAGAGGIDGLNSTPPASAAAAIATSSQQSQIAGA